MVASLVASNRERFFGCEMSPSFSRVVVVSLAMFSLFMVSGCTQNPYYAAPGSGAWQMSPAPAGTNPLESKVTELNRRVQLLDDNNRQLHTQLAQSEQKAEVFKDEAELLRQQLASMSEQLDASKQVAQDAESRVRGMQASTQMRGGAVITPNTNLSLQASQLSLPGLEVFPDGNQLRIRIPSDQLFQSGSAQLLPQASSVIDPVASQLITVFPRQRMSVEAYTDQSNQLGDTSASPLQLTSAQAAAVIGLMSRFNGLDSTRLSAIAQGSSRPRGNNETPIGRSNNRRIEIVIHPDTI